MSEFAGSSESPLAPPVKVPVILMADADHLTGWALQQYLSGAYLVIQVGTVGDALSVLATRPVSGVIVSDNLPGGNLEQLLEAAALKVAPGRVIKLVPMIEAPMDRKPEKAFLVEKPFSLEHLRTLLDEMCRLGSSNVDHAETKDSSSKSIGGPGDRERPGITD